MRAWLKQLSDNLNFTPTERAVVLTLVGAFVLGLGIRLFRNEDAPIPRFDYSAPDAEFSSRSAASPPAADARTSPGSIAGAPGASTGLSARPKAGPLSVDLNRATRRDLMSLPGVGEVIADRILLYREEHGAFAGVNDLLKVKGIGKKKLEHIAPFCFVEK
jgi:competence ComEA-like helix-hairpin-helix protein